MDLGTVNRSQKTLSQKPRLTRDPLGYATEMMNMFGVWKYCFRPFLCTVPQQKTGLVGYNLPANIEEIMDVVNRSRSDLPNLDDFNDFSEEAVMAAYSTDEGNIEAILREFVTLKTWNRPHGISGRQKLIIPDGALPQGQGSISPDCCFGLDPSFIKMQCDWVATYIRGPTKNSQQICCNGIVEYKSSGGNMAGAVSHSSLASLLQYLKVF